MSPYLNDEWVKEADMHDDISGVEAAARIRANGQPRLLIRRVYHDRLVSGGKLGSSSLRLAFPRVFASAIIHTIAALRTFQTRRLVRSMVLVSRGHRQVRAGAMMNFSNHHRMTLADGMAIRWSIFLFIYAADQHYCVLTSSLARYISGT